MTVDFSLYRLIEKKGGFLIAFSVLAITIGMSLAFFSKKIDGGGIASFTLQLEGR